MRGLPQPEVLPQQFLAPGVLAGAAGWAEVLPQHGEPAEWEHAAELEAPEPEQQDSGLTAKASRLAGE